VVPFVSGFVHTYKQLAPTLFTTKNNGDGNEFQNKTMHVIFNKDRSIRLYEDYDLNRYYVRQIFPVHPSSRRNSFPFREKIGSLFALTRPSNIVPVALLNFIGGYIVNPSVSFLQDKNFLILMLITQLVTGASMVINDVFDLEVDKRNNKRRPIPLGKVTPKEATLFFLFLSITAFTINGVFLRSGWVVLDILLITLYTPVFKKIPLIKNIVCSSVVANTIYLSGFFANKPSSIVSNVLLQSASSVIFFNSLFIEILLDIVDKQGDKENKIYTLPVLFGNDMTLFMASLFLSLGTSMSLLLLDNKYPVISSYLLSSMLFSFMNIILCKSKNYSKSVITKVSKSTNYSILFYLLSIFISNNI
jgi:4-hydroxybenzoate polyprenyltransferase